MAERERKTPSSQEAASVPPEDETIYSRDELIAAASAFGVTPEVVAGALRLAGTDRMTRAGAEAAIKRFLTREV